jgi:hypothetical protein
MTGSKNLRVWVSCAYLSVCAIAAVSMQFMIESFDRHPEPSTSWSDVLLGYVSIASIVLVAAMLRHRNATGFLDLKRRLRLEVDALPFHARGWRFFALTFVLSLFFAVLAHEGKGCPFVGHDDLLPWLMNSLFVALVAALVSYWLTRAIPAAAIAIVALFLGEPPKPLQHAFDAVVLDASALRHESWPAPLFNRPPPLQL